MGKDLGYSRGEDGFFSSSRPECHTPYTIGLTGIQYKISPSGASESFVCLFASQLMLSDAVHSQFRVGIRLSLHLAGPPARVRSTNPPPEGGFVLRSPKTPPGAGNGPIPGPAFPFLIKG